MGLFFFNTMGRKLSEFTPLVPGQVRMYTCGPTVYHFAHIGNFRAYVFEDILRRTLKYYGYQVTQVMNLTDVDDKTIRGARQAGCSLDSYTAQYKKAFFEDLASLRIEPAEHYPAATDHIPEMISLIKILLDKGYAYRAEDASIYYSIAKFKDYGKLAQIDLAQQRSGVRIKNDEYEKEAAADFALWKAWDEADGDIAWESPWGRGRPGWHIECSAMSMKYLGAHFDIHTGGIDNMFPHHEDEIAQSEAANACAYVNYWLHCAHLIVNGEKMSKSLGNFYTLREVLAKGFSGADVRWVLLGTHYRKKLDFTFDDCAQAQVTRKKFQAFFQRLNAAKASSGSDVKGIVEESRKKFRDALGDDLNISEAIAAVYHLEREANKLLESNSLSAAGAQELLAQFRDFDRVLAVLDLDAAEISVPKEIMELAEKRQAARKAKDFAGADALRDQLKALGWVVEDTPSGPRPKRL